MPSKTKTIKINPADFQMSKKGNAKKTSKKRDGGDVIKPNKIKKKLLERIKQHSRNTNKLTTGGGEEKEEPTPSYKDEFYDSIGYLSKLAEESQITSPYNKKPMGKTIKKRETQPPPHIQVDLNLPEGLKEHSPPDANSIPSSASSISLNHPVQRTSPPYGCLKGGSKPTFRAWNRTQKANVVDVPPVVAMPASEIPTRPTTNEERLAKLKESFKQRHHQVANSVTSTTEPIPAPPVLTPVVTEPAPVSDISTPHMTTPVVTNAVGGSYMALQEEQKIISSIRVPKKTKKTTTRKYGLGKNNKKRVIGVLIKDRQTRKKILDAQKDIRRKSLVDVKKYLNDHGLIKAGSRAPNDVVRKIYESSVMSGEITNTDDEIMAHNFMNA